MAKVYIKNGENAWTELTEEQQRSAASLNLWLTVLGAIGLVIWLLVS